MNYNPEILDRPEPPETGCYCVNCGEMIIPQDDWWVWDEEYVCDEYCMTEYCRSLRATINAKDRAIEKLVKEKTMGVWT